MLPFGMGLFSIFHFLIVHYLYVQIQLPFSMLILCIVVLLGSQSELSVKSVELSCPSSGYHLQTEKKVCLFMTSFFQFLSLI